MSFKSWLDLKMKKLDWLDMALVKFSCIAFGILLVMLIPGLAAINVWWIVAVVILLAIRPTYRGFTFSVG
ncbi:MAG: hypothetical protein Q8N87_02950 [bacterium]|nr:hypothetical protein [bacterium]